VFALPNSNMFNADKEKITNSITSQINIPVQFRWVFSSAKHYIFHAWPNMRY